MNALPVLLGPARLLALGSGALFWPDEALLCVADLHLAKSDRIARREGRLLPPYETRATLDRLAADCAATGARAVVCLGDSFDDPAGPGALDPADRAQLLALMAGRDWVWIEGNHDPGGNGLGGDCRREIVLAGLAFRHIAAAGTPGPEVSGHFHPKLALPGGGPARPAFLTDGVRLILPAYGAYTGGMAAAEVARLAGLSAGARALLTGRRPLPVPLPPAAAARRATSPVRPGRFG